MAGSRFFVCGWVPRLAAGLVLVVVCTGVLAVAGSARAVPITDPNSLTSIFQALDFGIFDSAYSPDDVLDSAIMSSQPSQQADAAASEFLGLLFDGVVIDDDFTPFTPNPVGSIANLITIQFTVPVLGFTTTLHSGTTDGGQGNDPVGVSFRATFEGGATETIQFPVDANDPNQRFGPPFNALGKFVGIVSPDPDLFITMIEVFQSPLGSPEDIVAPGAFPSLGTSFPRIGGPNTTVAIVPEPGTLVLLGVALAGLGLIRPRRRR